jgi:hypothetical protein
MGINGSDNVGVRKLGVITCDFRDDSVTPRNTSWLELLIGRKRHKEVKFVINADLGGADVNFRCGMC